MTQASDSTVWMDLCSLPGPGVGVVLVSAVMVAVAVVVIAALCLFIGRRFGRRSTRREHLAALLGSSTGFALMSSGFVLYLSSPAWADRERFELYSAVFAGALLFSASAMTFCKLRGVLFPKRVARPGHHLVNLFAILLGGWLGYGFVTEQAQPFGLAALIAAAALAWAIGIHMTTSREYHGGHVFSTGRQGLDACIEWHGGDEPAWVLREITAGNVRAAAYRHRRDWHKSTDRKDSTGPVRCKRVNARRRLTQFSTRRRT